MEIFEIVAYYVFVSFIKPSNFHSSDFSEHENEIAYLRFPQRNLIKPHGKHLKFYSFIVRAFYYTFCNINEFLISCRFKENF